MGAMRPMHWVVVLVVVLILFGAKRLPDLAKGIGQSLKIFKKEIKDLQEDPPAAPTVIPPTAAAPAPGVATEQTLDPSAQAPDN